MNQPGASTVTGPAASKVFYRQIHCVAHLAPKSQGGAAAFAAVARLRR
jgi:hypothetical protein